MNRKLVELYEQYWDDMISSLKGTKLGNPLLIHIKNEEKYHNADIKIMFFGQETNGWEGVIGSKNINQLQNTYSLFLERRYGGQFWNAVHDYVNTIKGMNPDKQVEFVWNNIIKIGNDKSKGKPKENLIDMQKQVFPVIRAEVEILKPDIVIFFTGPYYDRFIHDEWEELQLQGVTQFTERQLAVLNHNLLPINAFRTYHPNFLYRQGKEFFTKVKETIIITNSTRGT
jgi:hypothetical protein